MPRLSYDELEREYRSTLRQLVQERHRSEALERRLLAEAARHRQGAQAIDLSIESLKRTESRQDTARAMKAAARHSHVDLTSIEADPHGERNG